jgi:methionine-rich copper-binding protein CopC
VADNEADCTGCGTTGTGTCGNGTCFGPDESSFSTSFAAGSALAPLTSSAPAWRIDTTQGYAGGSSLKSGTTPDNGSSTVTLVTTTVAGQGLSFWYKVSSEPTWDLLRFKVDGTTRGEWSGTVNWTQFTTTLTAGSHTLVWEFRKDGSTSTSPDAGWIDELRITSPNSCGDDCSLSVDSGAGCVACAPPADDCTACNGGTEVCISGNCGGLGTTSVVETFESATWPAAFTSTSASRWTSDAAVPAPGADQGLRSAKSGAILSDSPPASTAFQRTFTVGAGGSLSFKYRVSSEPNYDFFKVTVDGTEVLSASGTVAWTDFTRALTAGNHTVVWSYSKDGSTDTGSDAAWVDLITVTDATSCAGDSCGNAGYDGGACLTCDPTACY